MTRLNAVSWYARRLVALVLAVASIPAFFFYSDVLARAFQGVAHLEVEPRFTGGRVAAAFYDPLGDDDGFGGLTYPRHQRFAPGALDLVRYAVHEPVYGAMWTGQSEYWQLDFSFASDPADVRTIRVYIDADGDGAGAAAPRDEQAEGVAFDPARPWDYVLAIEGTSARFESSAGDFTAPAAVYSLEGGKKLTVRVALSDRRLRGLFAASSTAHYVLVGAWSPWGRDGFAPVAKRAGDGTGGGAPSPLTPKVYDWLAPEGVSQEAALSAWDEDALTVPTVPPVVASMRAASSGRPGSAGFDRDNALVARLEALVASEAAAAKAKAESEWVSVAGMTPGLPTDAEGRMRYGLAAFSADHADEALAAFDAILADSPDDARALAYRGSLISMTARDASPLAAVDIVARSFVDLDRAVALAKTADEIDTARTCRANVSQAVPNTVFGKATTGAEDWLAVAALYASSATAGDNMEAAIAAAYCNAAICYGLAGRDDDAELWWRETARWAAKAAAPQSGGASSSGDTAGSAAPAWVRLALAKRGVAVAP